MTSADIPPMSFVSSSNVEAVGHHADRNELHVKFKNGSHYIYHDADRSHHEAILQAHSAGKHIASNIKGRFRTTKLD